MEIADDLSWWSVEAPGRITASAVALTGPTADPNKRVQTINPPGSGVGPGEHVVATWGVGEKVLPHAHAVRQVAGALLIAYGLLVIVDPSLLPGSPTHTHF